MHSSVPELMKSIQARTAPSWTSLQLVWLHQLERWRSKSHFITNTEFLFLFFSEEVPLKDECNAQFLIFLSSFDIQLWIWCVASYLQVYTSKACTQTSDNLVVFLESAKCDVSLITNYNQAKLSGCGELDGCAESRIWAFWGPDITQCWMIVSVSHCSQCVD